MKQLRNIALLTAAALLLTGTSAAVTAGAETEDRNGNPCETGTLDALTYFKYEDHIAIANYNHESEATEVEIPAEIEGLPVTVIDIAAFSYPLFEERECSLTKVVIPDTVTEIKFLAFEGCSSLQSVNIPKGVTTIQDRLFYHCSALEEIELHEGITSIGESAFTGCSSLKSIRLPKSLRNISYGAFQGCELFERVEIPSGVQYIGSFAFSSCLALRTIQIPNGVENIDMAVFANCSSLESVFIPKTVTSIDSAAFDECNALTDVYYGSTEETWSAVEIANGNDPLLKATVHFRDEESLGDLDDDGEITVTDAQLALQGAAELMNGNDSGLTPAQLAAVDIDGDGTLTVIDSQLILNYYAAVTLGGLECTWQDIIDGKF